MGKGNEETFFQREDINGQLVHENMLNIIYHQGNATENHDKISPHTFQNSITSHILEQQSSKRQKIQIFGKGVIKGNSCALFLGM